METVSGLNRLMGAVTRIWAGAPSDSVAVGLRVLITPMNTVPENSSSVPRIMSPLPIST